MPTKTRPRSTPSNGDPRVSELERALADRLVSETDLDALGVLDRTTRYRMVRAGTFPPPIRLTPARKAWRWSAILAWLAEREANPVVRRAYFGRSEDADHQPAAGPGSQPKPAAVAGKRSPRR